MFEQQNQFNPMFPIPVQQPNIGGSVNLFGDVTIIHNQQLDPMSAINRQMEMMNNRMMDYTNRMTQYALEAKAMALKQAAIELDNRKLDMQQALLENPQNIPKLKQAIGVKTHKISNPFNNDEDDDIVDDVEFTIEDHTESRTEEFKVTPQNILNPSKYSQYIDLAKYFTNEYELNDSIKHALVYNGCTTFMGEGGNKPVIIFARYTSDTETIYSYWRKIIRISYDKLTKSVISKANFITVNTPIILFMYDKSLFKADIICIKPTTESEFLSINVPKRVEEYSMCKEFRGWIEDENPLILNKRINSAYIFAEPFQINNLKFPKNADKRLENIDIVSAFYDSTYSVPISDLHLKSTVIYKS